VIDLALLNDQQREAVVHAGGPLVVFAGAGSGKTRVITYRIAWLVDELGVAPWQILALTFTNKAAGEMRERLDGLLPGDAGQRIWVGTFHATCARLLRRFHEQVGIRRDFTIYDDSDQQALLTRILRDERIDERRYPPRMVGSQINRAKQEVIPPEELPATSDFAEMIQRLYGLYEARLQAAGALDFGDLIYRLVRALEADDAFRDDLARRFEHLLVDEFQDTNQAQYRLLKALASEHRNLCVVGDDDQSIYRWRGADRRLILGFREAFPEATLVKLEQNYRSTKRILRVANGVIARNRSREPKELWTDNEDGQKVLVVRNEDHLEEARMVVRALREARRAGISPSEIAVFYRTHAQSRVIEEALRAADQPYRVIGGTRFYDRAEVKDVLAYLRVLHNPDDDVSLLRIINTPPRGIGRTTIDRLTDAAAAGGRGLWAALEDPATLGRLSTAPKKKVVAFRELISGLREEVARGVPVLEVTEELVARTGYDEWLANQDSAEADARRQNLGELLGSIREWQANAPEEPSLASFLELVTLQTNADEGDAAEEHVTLMTVHAAKGLEFALVLVTGLEEQMFPYRGVDPAEDPEELEEERRLAYVAFTRARERLVLSWTVVRTIFGQPRVNQPSRFLDELPEDDLDRVGRTDPVPRPAMRSLHAFQSDEAEWQPPEGSRYARRAAEPLPTAPPQGGDLAVDDIAPGARVRHARFGEGKVQEVTPGTPPRVLVAFPGHGAKRIAIGFLTRA